MAREANKKALIVLRVSGEAQVGNTSFETQEEMARGVAERLGAEVIHVYREEAVSGSLYLSREHLQEAIGRIEMGEAKYLIFGQFDRSARSVVNVELMYRRILAAGGEIHHADFTFENSPDGKMMRQFVSVIKEHERDAIAVRTKRGRRHRAHQGRMPFTHMSGFGHHVVTREDVESGAYGEEMYQRCIADRGQAPMVVSLFEKFVNDEMSYTALCRWLGESGVKSPQFGKPQRESSGIWHPLSVKRVLQNTAHVGVIRFGKVDIQTDETRRTERGLKTIRFQVAASTAPIEIPCEAVVSQSLFDAAQERIAAIASGDGTTRRGRGNRAVSLLAGLLKCPECGSPMTRISRMEHGREYAHYRCPYGAGAKRQFEVRSKCGHNKNYRLRDLDRQVIDVVLEVARRPERVADAVEAYQREFLQRGGDEALRDILQAEMAEIAKKEIVAARKQIEAEVSGASTETYDALLLEYNERRATLRKHMASMPPVGTERTGITRERMEQFAAQVRVLEEVLLSASVPDSVKREGLQEVVAHIDVDGDQIATVWFRGFRSNAIAVCHSETASRRGCDMVYGRAENGQIVLGMSALLQVV